MQANIRREAKNPKKSNKILHQKLAFDGKIWKWSEQEQKMMETNWVANEPPKNY